jgi:hypothetical protein
MMIFGFYSSSQGDMFYSSSTFLSHGTSIYQPEIFPPKGEMALSLINFLFDKVFLKPTRGESLSQFIGNIFNCMP